MTPPMTPGIRALPRNKAGYPVPWFVAWIDGEPDFRVIKPEAIAEAWTVPRCWVCGRNRGRWGSFVIGPMCAVNRTSAEPPSHPDCAHWSARVCPFLTRPSMVRRDKHMPDGAVQPAGIMLRRNPGVALVWTSRDAKPWRTPEGGILFDIGTPHSVDWYAEGRPATRREVLASIDSGLPSLRRIAADEGEAALTELGRMHAAALELVPT